MKRSGRTLKQRLYGINHLPSWVRRARFFRGHGVHSPYVYSIVRQVFMRSTLTDDDHSLYDALLLKQTVRQRAVQLQNLLHHCNYATWCIDQMERVDMIIVTLDTSYEQLAAFNTYAREVGATLCILKPYNNAQRWAACREIIEMHPSTTVDNRGYLLIFNNHLPKQRFRL